ncbi:hypothetical protein AB0395_25930 [Streptosporangium sp. NPDC051023]|uniref:hypothetical protein n=1 Tax=Streptosporangium sp. NPDC051023 TaxID=3155410 RepID=UPI00344F9C4F
MDEWTAGNVAAEWELARRLPWWTVWYGEYTRMFWAVPRAGHLSAAPHIEAATPQELEHEARRVERAVAERTPCHRGEPRSAGRVWSGVPDAEGDAVERSGVREPVPVDEPPRDPSDQAQPVLQPQPQTPG